MTRARADVAEAKVVQELADRPLMVGDAVSLGDEALQVDPSPTHHVSDRPAADFGYDPVRQGWRASLPGPSLQHAAQRLGSQANTIV